MGVIVKKLLFTLFLGIFLMSLASAGTISYNTNTKTLNVIYRATNNGTVFSSNLAGTATFDYFNDTAAVNDAIYFSSGNPYAFSDIVVDVGTALSATSITIVWEYYQYGVGWTPLNNFQDDTNGFQIAGVNTIRFPYQWNWHQTTINGGNYAWIRARITAVSGLTEGGANQNTTPYAKDGMVNIDGYSDASPCSFTLVSDYLESTYPYLGTIKTGQYFDFRFIGLNINSRLKSTNEFIETHNGYYSYQTIGRNQKWYYLQLGNKVGTESGKDGSTIYVNAAANTYPFTLNSYFRMYGSTIRSYNAQAGYPTLYGEYLDSNLELRPRLASSATMINDRIYIGGGLIQGGAFPSTFTKNKFIIGHELALVYQGSFTTVEMDYGFTSSGTSMLYLYQTYTDANWTFIDQVTPLPSQATSPYMILRSIGATKTIASYINYDNTTGFTNQTVEANDASVDDVSVTGATGNPEVGDALYINLGTGTNLQAQTRLDITMGSVLNSDNTFIWEIYTGKWEKAKIWDGTYNFTQSGSLWVSKRAESNNQQIKTTVNGSSGYWLRARVVSAGVSKPLITQIKGATETGVARWNAYEKYHIAVKITDESGNPIDNATVIIKNKAGDLQFSTQTNANGSISEQAPITTRDFYFDPLDNSSLHQQIADVTTGEYTIEVSHPDYHSKTFSFNLTKKTDWTLALKKRLVWNYSVPPLFLVRNKTTTGVFKISPEGNLAIAGKLYELIKPSGPFGIEIRSSRAS